ELRTALELTVEPYSSGRLSSSNVTMPSLASAQARQPGVSTSAPGGLTTHGGAAALPANTAQASAVGAASSASSVAPVAPVVPVTPVKPRSAAPLILGIVALLLLAGVGVGGWYVWTHKPIVGPTPTPTPSVNAKPVEALNYWIEAFDSPTQTTGRRVANEGATSLRSSQQFRFHFTARHRGY